MQLHTLFSRRKAARLDFRPDERGAGSPYSQLRRLRSYMAGDNLTGDDLTGCDDAVEALVEYSYRKIFTGTSHAEYLDLKKNCPEHIEWIVAIHEMESDRFRNAKKDAPSNVPISVTLDGRSIAKSIGKA